MTESKLLELYVVCIAMSVLLFTGLAPSKSKNIVKEFSQKGEKDIYTRLVSIPILEVFKEINQISLKSKNPDTFIIYTAALLHRIDEISEETILTAIEDDNNSIELRILMIQLSKKKNDSNGLMDKTIFYRLLRDDKTHSEIMHNAIYALSDDWYTSVILEEISDGQDDILAFHAIKRLSQIDGNKALHIADKILKNYTDFNEERIRIAIKVKTQQLAKNLSTTAEKDEFIELCQILYENSKDELMRDSIVFALSDLMDEKAISYIVLNEDIEEYMKICCIDQNYPTLLSMIQEGISKKSLRTILYAMDIYPINELIAPLTTLCNSLG